jgi:2-oxoglutarate ferredoxin oxidoreductase subunit alpha
MSIELHSREVRKKGQIIYDSETLALDKNRKKEQDGSTGTDYLDVPFASLAVEHGGNKIMSNTVATGTVLGMLNMKLDILLEILQDTFKKKGDEIVQANIKSAQAGHEYAVNECLSCAFSTGETAKPRMLISGTESIGLGAVISGCKFYSAYPMTPSTGVMNYIAGKEKEHNIIVEQAEDEISAINMALGASFAGVRAMTGTSGGGFALMVEGLSLAGITETPIVIALGQRPGPATGLPTRTEQGDLLFVLHAAHGEFPRAVFAPGTPEQAFYLTNKAFEMAEKYQIPSFILFDQYLGDSTWTYDGFDMNTIIYNDYRLRGEKFQQTEGYRRHAFTETGISPFGVPGESAHLVVTDSDEHDEAGHITEDAETRIQMVRKRLFNKLPLIRKDIAPPVLYGKDKPDTVLVGWGSTYGVMKEAVDILARDKNIALLHFSEIYPFPSTDSFDYLNVLERADVAICVEQNATGQFARLMRAETGFSLDHQVLRYDGRPFMVETLLGELDAHVG